MYAAPRMEKVLVRGSTLPSLSKTLEWGPAEAKLVPLDCKPGKASCAAVLPEEQGADNQVRSWSQLRTNTVSLLDIPILEHPGTEYHGLGAPRTMETVGGYAVCWRDFLAFFGSGASDAPLFLSFPGGLKLFVLFLTFSSMKSAKRDGCIAALRQADGLP